MLTVQTVPHNNGDESGLATFWPMSRANHSSRLDADVEVYQPGAARHHYALLQMHELPRSCFLQRSQTRRTAVKLTS